MGAKGYEIDRIIIKILKNGQKSGKELQSSVKKELSLKFPLNFKKTFDQALIKLVECEDVKIVGYDPSADDRKAKQSFKSDPIVFDLSERLTRPKIQNQLNEMYKNDEAYQAIKKLFKKRLIELSAFEKDRWDRLKHSASYLTSDGIKNILSRSYDLNKIENIIRSLPKKERDEIKEYYLYLRGSIETINPVIIKDLQRILREEQVIKNKKEISALSHPILTVLLFGLLLSLQAYENANFWYFPIDTKQFENIWGVGFDWIYEELSEGHFSLNNPISIILTKFTIVDSYEGLDREEILDKAGFINHYKKDNMDSFFEYTIDILSTYSKEDQAILFGILAKCLSDEKGYLRAFHDFYVKIQKVNYGNRLATVLKIHEP